MGSFIRFGTVCWAVGDGNQAQITRLPGPDPRSRRLSALRAEKLDVSACPGQGCPDEETRTSLCPTRNVVVVASHSTAFSPDNVDAIAGAACDRVGLDARGATLLRLGENMLYRLASVPAVIRIARGPAYWANATKEVAVAQWLATEGFPAAELLDVGVSQPISVKGHPVTFWRLLPGRPGETSDEGALGTVLRRLHQLRPPGDLVLPGVEVFDRVEARLEAAQIPEDDKTTVLDRIENLRAELVDVTFRLAPTAIHGDAHIKNLMMQPSGQAVLIDLEAFAWGHPEWDLAKTATEYGVGMVPGDDYRAFVDAYGVDITQWDGFSTLQDVLRIKMTTWLAQNVAHSPDLAAEYRKRIRTIRSGEIQQPWHGF